MKVGSVVFDELTTNSVRIKVQIEYDKSDYIAITRMYDFSVEYYNVVNESRKATKIMHSGEIAKKMTITYVLSGLNPSQMYVLKFKWKSKSTGAYNKYYNKQFPVQTKPQEAESIILNNITLDVNTEKKLVYSFLPTNTTNKKVEITVDDENVAKYIGGNIVGISKGTTEIHIKAIKTRYDDIVVEDDVIATATITVELPLRDIKVDKSRMVIRKNAVDNIYAYAMPTHASHSTITYTSSNSSIASVDATGSVRALNKGNCIIYVKNTYYDIEKQVAVDVIAEGYEFTELKAPDVLTPEFVNTIHRNCETIYNLFQNKGIQCDILELVSVSRGTELIDIKKFLNDIENNLDKLNDENNVGDYQSLYYVESRSYDRSVAENKEDIQRWCDILNDLYNILTGVYSKWGRLLCTEGGNKYPMIDGNYIACHKEE